jgi:hypothetical protein
MILVTPPDHPLARKRRVRATDMADHALVNSPSSFADTEFPDQIAMMADNLTNPLAVLASC